MTVYGPATNAKISATKEWWSSEDDGGTWCVVKARATSNTVNGNGPAYFGWVETNDYSGPWCRIVRSSSGVGFDAGTILASGPAQPMNEDRISIEVNGTSLTLKNETTSTVLCTATDATYTTGYWMNVAGLTPIFASYDVTAEYYPLFFGAGL